MDLGNKLIKYIEDKSKPIKLNERAKSKINVLFSKYGYKLVKECIDISFSKYIEYDQEGYVTKDSFNNFFNKIGGIAHNKSLSPLEIQKTHLLNIGKKTYDYWDDKKARIYIDLYVKALRENDWSEDDIIKDLENDLKNNFKVNRNWSEWIAHISDWIDQINNWKQK